ncbi:hypothetical protein GCM10010977_02560 [Citricoccus zhacaiensis]|uniref:Phage gp6-like head-tail connector protein n=1 Tax=Citricoccus zhacaiensis TaxID=489142 RepID=A0ABQ2LMP5_9MICC|nr:hypothetical protein [Citricoccus zhacaiensis]GGO40365.1 hypothetical protein GCM10010977_02560 [Citricoccus zhacaiensis]
MTAPTGADVAAFLGAADDTELTALADEHVAVVTTMVRAYTRGGGFAAGTPNDELAAVITTATARLVANPEQVGYSVGSVRQDAGFKGFSLAETFVLNRYRRRSA